MRVELVDNDAGSRVGAARLGAAWGQAFVLRVALSNRSAVDLPATGWQLHVPSVRRLLAVAAGPFQLDRVTGDHHILAPTEGFAGLPAGDVLEVDLVGEGFVLQAPEILPRWYLTARDTDPAVLAATDGDESEPFTVSFTARQVVGPADRTVLATAQTRYRRNAELPDAAAATLLPSPLRHTIGPGSLAVEQGLLLTDFDHEIGSATRDWWVRRAAVLGVSLHVGSAGTGLEVPMRVRIDPDALDPIARQPEGYRLTVSPAGIEAVGFDARGAHWAVMSLFGLLPAPGEPPVVPVGVMLDAPRYQHRSVMLDIGRNFRGLDYLRRLVDQLSAYKLNVLHLHLTEDEGWRLEIPGLPELTDVGARRGHTVDESDRLQPQLGSGPGEGNAGSGYLSRTDYIALLAHAKACGVEVLPELNMPGHSRAAVQAMEARYHRLLQAGDPVGAEEFRLVDPADSSRIHTVQHYGAAATLNPALPGTKAFIGQVVAQIAEMHAAAGAPLRVLHCGGDEVSNILLGEGYGDLADPQPGLGLVDRAVQTEPWAGSPVAQRVAGSAGLTDVGALSALLLADVAAAANDSGVMLLHAWHDGWARVTAAADLPVAGVAEVWQPASAGAVERLAQLQRRGFGTVGCAPDFTYFDAPYEADPAERGATWATRALDERIAFSYPPDNLPQAAAYHLQRFGAEYRDRVPATGLAPMYGVQAHLWSEACRTEAHVDGMLFPRLLAFAERAWHRAQWEADAEPGRSYEPADPSVDREALLLDCSGFVRALGRRELAKLDAAAVAYRVPLAGAEIDPDGQLNCNTALPGLPIQYSLDGGKTWLDWRPGVVVAAGGRALVRVLSADRGRSSRVSEVAALS